MSFEKDDFQADGAGNPFAGFHTFSTTLTHGVNVQGNTCGAYAEALATSPGLRSPQSGSRPGVWGAGDHYGVYGASNRLYNAVSQPPVDHTPVLSPDIAVGTRMFGAIGVVGASMTLPGVLGTSALTNAEVSTSNINTGMVGDIVKHPAGVTGISGTSRTVDGLAPAPVLGSAGVLGMSVRDVPNLNVGLDVRIKGFLASGSPGSGVGVFGWSFLGRGGVFGSAAPMIDGLPAPTAVNIGSAQIRLLPAVVSTADVGTSKPPVHQLPSLPSLGQAGDLIAVIEPPAPGAGPATTQLWFCIASGSATKRATWAEIAFARTIPGSH